MSQLRIDTHEHGTIAVFHLNGDVTDEANETLRSAYGAAVDGGATAVIIELANAAYINTSGISVLITLAMDAQKTSISMAVAGASPHYRKVFDLVQFSTFVAMYDDEAAALAELG